MAKNSIGLIEVTSIAAGYLSCDAMLKAADVDSSNISDAAVVARLWIPDTASFRPLMPISAMQCGRRTTAGAPPASMTARAMCRHRHQ